MNTSSDLSRDRGRSDRRQFLSLLGAAGAAAACPIALSSASLSPAAAAEPFARKGDPRFLVGLAAYSMRDYFSFMKGKAKTPKDTEKAIDMVGFLDFCIKEGFDAAELTSYFFPPDADKDYFLDIKREAYLRGLVISGTAIGNNFTLGAGKKLEQEVESAMKWIEHAAQMGAPHIRFFAGTGKQLEEHPERMTEVVDAMKRCADRAAEHGIFLGIENHGNLSSEQLLDIIHAVDHPWVGINLDTGNFLSDDPYRELEACAPYAVNVQVKVNMKKPDRSEYPADFDRIATILRDADYQGFVILEYEDQQPYKNIPAAADRLRKALGH